MRSGFKTQFVNKNKNLPDGVNSYNIDVVEGGFRIVSKILNTKEEI